MDIAWRGQENSIKRFAEREEMICGGGFIKMRASQGSQSKGDLILRDCF